MLPNVTKECYLFGGFFGGWGSFFRGGLLDCRLFGLQNNDERMIRSVTDGDLTIQNSKLQLTSVPGSVSCTEPSAFTAFHAAARPTLASQLRL